MLEKTSLTRRRLLAWLGGAGAAALLFGALPGRAFADLPHLDPATDPTAKALHYTEDASKAPPPHKAGEDCSNCRFYSGKPGQAYGPCSLYPGKAVNAKGWCAGYSAKA